MAPKKAEGRDSYLQPGRQKKVSMLVWVESEQRKAVKRIALESDRTQQEVLEEALTDLFKKYKVRIDPR